MTTLLRILCYFLKMNYLVSLFSNEVAMTIKRLKLSNANYSVTLGFFKKRFRDPQLLMLSHISQLLDLSTVISKKIY